MLNAGAFKTAGPAIPLPQAAKRSLLELAPMCDGVGVQTLLLDELPVVQHAEFLRRILAHEEHDGLRAARVVPQELRHEHRAHSR